MKKVLFLFIFIHFLTTCYAISVRNPIDYGIEKASDGIERYNILLRCHEDAIREGASISYRGLDTIRIDIPQNAVTIPLSRETDFSGVTILVTNNSKEFLLFNLNDAVCSLSGVNGKNIDSGNYNNIEQLKNGKHLLIIEDRNLWTPRTGYATKTYRRDIQIVKNGIALNSPTYNYDTPTSSPITWFKKIDDKRIIIKNLTFIRTKESTQKTYCLRIDNQFNVELNTIKIITPEDSIKYADYAISIHDCANVTLNNITINGTYSQSHKYGYGISLNNIYNLKVKKMYARSKWGVFGTNNLNKVVLKDCDINRFDIHCYGRDIKMVNCKFSSYYNQFSSIYGRVLFKRCSFSNFTPLLIESSFNAYTPFDVEWRNCQFYLDSNNDYIITLRGVPAEINERLELATKCLPNIRMVNCELFMDNSIKEWYLIKTGGLEYNGSFGYTTKIILESIKVHSSKDVSFSVSTEPISYVNSIHTQYRIKRIQ